MVIFKTRVGDDRFGQCIASCHSVDVFKLLLKLRHLFLKIVLTVDLNRQGQPILLLHFFKLSQRNQIVIKVFELT